MTLTAHVRAWESTGTHLDAGGHRVFVRRQDGAGPLLVPLHGYPSSSYDCARLWPHRHGRPVLAYCAIQSRRARVCTARDASSSSAG